MSWTSWIELDQLDHLELDELDQELDQLDRFELDELDQELDRAQISTFPPTPPREAREIFFPKNNFPRAKRAIFFKYFDHF